MRDRKLLDELLELLDDPALKRFRRDLNCNLGTRCACLEPLFEGELQRLRIELHGLQVLHVGKLTMWLKVGTQAIRLVP